MVATNGMATMSKFGRPPSASRDRASGKAAATGLPILILTFDFMYLSHRIAESCVLSMSGHFPAHQLCRRNREDSRGPFIPVYQ
ncbi:hypothetical protein ASF14_03610 [Sphingomonas sp. Leaf257]|jgi:hypothetical protein|nr:hypothetical protein ASF14_03610 [Sphingomonas sp. Leaf257]